MKDSYGRRYATYPRNATGRYAPMRKPLFILSRKDGSGHIPGLCHRVVRQSGSASDFNERAADRPDARRGRRERRMKACRSCTWVGARFRGIHGRACRLPSIAMRKTVRLATFPTKSNNRRYRIGTRLIVRAIYGATDGERASRQPGKRGRGRNVKFTSADERRCYEDAGAKRSRQDVYY
jgi:hypothetical protein